MEMKAIMLLNVVLPVVALIVFGVASSYVANSRQSQPSIKILGALTVPMGIGLVVGTFGLLYGWACWILLALLVMCRYSFNLWRSPNESATSSTRAFWSWPYTVIAGVVAILVWPSLVRLLSLPRLSQMK